MILYVLLETKRDKLIRYNLIQVRNIHWFLIRYLPIDE